MVWIFCKGPNLQIRIETPKNEGFQLKIKRLSQKKGFESQIQSFLCEKWFESLYESKIVVFEPFPFPLTIHYWT